MKDRKKIAIICCIVAAAIVAVVVAVGLGAIGVPDPSGPGAGGGTSANSEFVSSDADEAVEPDGVESGQDGLNEQVQVASDDQAASGEPGTLAGSSESGTSGSSASSSSADAELSKAAGGDGEDGRAIELPEV